MEAGEESQRGSAPEQDGTTPDHVVRNLLLVFGALFVTLTALDLASTYIGLRFREELVETPYTDTSSLIGMIRPEVVLLIVGGLAVWLGARIRKPLLSTARESGFGPFVDTVFAPRALPISALIFMPMLLALGRSMPVLNNLSYLIFGWSPIGNIPPIADVILFAVVFSYPTAYLIYRICRTA